MPINAPAAPAAKTPRTTGTAKTTGKTLASTGKTAAREEGLQGVMQIAAAIALMTKNYADAGALDMHGPPVCHEIAVLAEDSEPIANICDRLNTVGPYAALLTATLPLVMQMLVNHGKMDAGVAGGFGGKIMSKEALAARTKAEVDKQTAAFLREAAEAEAEAAKTQAEIETLRRAAA
jgi:hypothetical protein